MSQFQFRPDDYLELMRADVPRFDELQAALVTATRGVNAGRVLELGTGTGETARRVFDAHPNASLVGIDESDSMLAHARRTLPEAADLRVARLQDPLPAGPFDLVVSALTLHHLNRREKADLFRRVAAALGTSGRFVLADVIVPDQAEDAVTPVTEGFDLPDPLPDQLAWLRDAGFEPRVTWAWKDLVVVSADLRRP